MKGSEREGARPGRSGGLIVLWVGVAVAVAVTLGLIGCNQSASSEDSPTADAAADSAAASAAEDGKEEEKKPPRERSTTVDVAQVTRGDLVLPVIAEGTIRARHTTEVHTEIAGRIARILVGEGSRVSAGDVIARLDAREHRVAYDEARSTYLEKLSRLAVEDDHVDATSGTSARESELESKVAQLERDERRGKISRSERLEREVALQVDALRQGAYRSDVVAARSGVSAAHAAMERAKLDLERTEVRAAFDGVVSDITVSAGEQVTANQRIAKLVDDVNLEAQVGVLESDLRGLDSGRPVLLEVSALEDTIPATLDILSPEVDPATRTCRVLMRLESDGRVRPGMYVKAVIAGDVVSDCLIVPREAVIMRDGRPLVFKIEDDRAKWTYVELGEGNDHVVEIRKVLRGGSLTPEDRVIVSGHLTLAHDAKVKVRRTVAPKDPWERQ